MRQQGPDFDLLIVVGSPGSGKTKLCRKLRVFHLDDEWRNMSEEEEAMSFEHLVHMSVVI